MNKYTNILYSTFLILFTIILFSYPSDIFSACKYGLIFWYNNILPSLFPFMIISSLLLESKIFIILSKLLSPITQILFNISGNGSIAFLLGMFCGYPMGAKITADLANKNYISSIEANRLISFCNNCSPIFIINVVCLQLLHNISYAPYIIIIQILSAISVGLVFRFYKLTTADNKKKGESFTNDNAPKKISKLLNDSIINSAYNTINIGSFIVFYCVLLQALELSNVIKLLNLFLSPIENILHISPSLQGKLIIGIFDISNGVSSVTNSLGDIHEKLLLLNIIINWGSFSVHSQTSNMLQGTNISFKTYLLGKFAQTLFCTIYTLLFCLF